MPKDINDPDGSIARWARASALDALKKSGDPEYLKEVGKAAAGTKHMDDVLDAYNQGKK